MKKYYTFVAVFVFAGMLLSTGSAFSQETKAKEDRRNQIEEQKKLEKIIEKERAKQKELEFFYGRSAGEKYSRFRDLYEVPPVPDLPRAPVVYAGRWSPDKSFTLSLTKQFREESVSKKSSFTVDDDVKKLRFTVSGSCREGDISIKIILPGGKTFNQVQIDASADVKWSQSMSIGEEDAKYKGEWTLEIKAAKATGMYSLTVSTY